MRDPGQTNHCRQHGERTGDPGNGARAYYPDEEGPDEIELFLDGKRPEVREIVGVPVVLPQTKPVGQIAEAIARSPSNDWSLRPMIALEGEIDNLGKPSCNVCGEMNDSSLPINQTQ